MRSRPSSSLWLLCAAFMLAQLAALFHSTQHELTPEGPGACEICTIAHVATPPPAALRLPPMPVPVAAVFEVLLPAVPVLFRHGPLTTGPPRLPA